MYTRCPSCDALFELSLHELTEAAGVVRCSNCGKTFNSLASLFERRPETEDQPLRGKGMPPLLTHRILVQPTLPGFDPEPGPEPDHAARDTPFSDSGLSDSASTDQLTERTQQRGAWIIASVVLIVLALAQLIWLLDFPDGLPGASPLTRPASQPTDALTLVARDLHPHPTLRDAVIISASLRNQSGMRIDFPVIELRLFDRSNQLVGALRLSPEDYLAHPARATSGLSAGGLVPLVIEVELPGSEATGFEFRFF